MQPFADHTDYAVLYDTDVSNDRLDALLARASRDIAAELRAADIDYANPSADFAADLSDVACSMVHRSLGDDTDDDGPEIPFGASQFSQGAGSYTRQVTLSNPYGDLFMTEAEKRKLGIGLPRAVALSPY